MSLGANLEPCTGGIAVKDSDGWTVAVVIQRDPHPAKGGGISHDECEARARVIADALNAAGLA